MPVSSGIPEVSMSERATVKRILSGYLHEKFDYLLNAETAERIAEECMKKIGLMQQYSGKVLWGEPDAS